MLKLVNREQMQEIDKVTVEEIGIPAMVLMERAAIKTAEHVMSLIQSRGEQREQKVLVVCGVGNNGGDGVATARLLFLAGVSVDSYILGNAQKMSEEMQKQVEIAKKVGVSFLHEPSYNKYSIILDAIFGVGLTRQITGVYEETIKKINASGAYIIAIDLPSGVDASSGNLQNTAIQANLTVTYGYLKVGLVRYPGCQVAGKVLVEEIGFPDFVYDRVMSRHSDWKESFTYEKKDLARLPQRPKHSNKGTFGKVLIVAGSHGMSGACYLSAKAALRTGAGLVRILTVEENRQIIQTSLPEAVVLTYSPDSIKDEKKRAEYVKVIQDSSAIVVGPGLGTNDLSEKILEMVLKNTKVWTIVDADGINLLANWITKELKETNQNCEDVSKQMANRIDCLERLLPNHVILTPHLKEFSRIIQSDIDKIYKMFLDTIDLCSYNKLLIYIIKDSITTVIHGNKRYFNTSGNDGLATGGTGDALTGIIAGLLAQGVEPYDAACLSVYVHGLTSENYSKEHYSGSMIASDVIEYIGDVLMTKEE